MDGNGIPIANGGIISNNDLYEIASQYFFMIKQLNGCEIFTHNSILNADKRLIIRTLKELSKGERKRYFA